MFGKQGGGEGKEGNENMNTNNQLGKAFSALCHFCVDSRPKVRKSAHEAVQEVLSARKEWEGIFSKAFGAFAVQKLKAPRDAAENGKHERRERREEKDVAIATATEALHVLGALKGSLAA